MSKRRTTRGANASDGTGHMRKGPAEYRRYMVTGKTWLPRFSEEWEPRQFTDTLRQLPSKHYQILRSEYQPAGRFPVVDQSQERTTGYSDQLHKVFSPSSDGIIIFGDHTRVFKFRTDPFVLGADGTHLLAPATRSVNLRFVFYMLQSMEIPDTGYNRHFKYLVNTSIRLPSLAEQRAIATVLSDLDELIGCLEVLIAKKQAIKQAAMQRLLTGRKRLPGFGGDWATRRAGDFGRFGSGSGFPVRYQGEEQGDYPFFKVSDMNRNSDKIFLTHSKNLITEHTRRILGAVAFPPKSIAFAKVGAAVFLERKRILAQPSCIDNNMAAFVLTDGRVDHLFVYYLFSSIRFGAFANTTALPSLSGGTLSRIQLPLPSLVEQRAIANVLSDMDAEIAALERRLDKTRVIKQGMMQQLLTGSIRLPVQDDSTKGDAYGT